MSTKLPPSGRDFQIYDAIHIANSSTRDQAKQHEISQTRVRQIVRRVVGWLGEVLPPQTKIAKEQETHLARQIAADRFQRQLEQITALWDATHDAKYAGIRIRLTTAQARLGAVGGLIDALAADALTASGGRQPTEAETIFHLRLNHPLPHSGTAHHRHHRPQHAPQNPHPHSR